MTRIDCVLDACDFLHVREPDQVRYHGHRRFRFIFGRHPHGCAHGSGFHGGQTTVQRCAIQSISMSTVWLAAFLHCLRNAPLSNSLVPNAVTATGSFRPVVAILLALVAAYVGWFHSPNAAVLIFRITLGYDAWISRGHQGGQGSPWIDRT